MTLCANHLPIFFSIIGRRFTVQEDGFSADKEAVKSTLREQMRDNPIYIIGALVSSHPENLVAAYLLAVLHRDSAQIQQALRKMRTKYYAADSDDLARVELILDPKSANFRDLPNEP